MIIAIKRDALSKIIQIIRNPDPDHLWIGKRKDGTLDRLYKMRWGKRDCVWALVVFMRK